MGKHLCEIFKNTYFEEHLCLAASELNFVSGSHLKPSRLQKHLQKYKSLSNQTFKKNSAYMSSIYLTPMLSCEPRFCVFIINGYYTKSNRLQSLDSSIQGVVIYYCVLFDQTRNSVDETVQWQHLNQYIKFIFTIENVVRLVLFVILF